MAETSVVKTPTQGLPPPNISDLDTSIFNIMTKNPTKVKGCQIYNVDYNGDKSKNRFVSPTFVVRQLTIGLVESSEDFKKDDSPNYFITVRRTGENDTGDTDALFEKVKSVEALMEKDDEFSATKMSSNIKTKDGKDPSIFFKLKYAKKRVKDPLNPKKTKGVTDKTRLSTAFYKAKKIDGKNVLVPLEFDPKNITDHIITNSVMEAHVTFDYVWSLNGQHGVSLHLDKVILLPPKQVVRASDMSMAVPDYMVASDSEDGGDKSSTKQEDDFDKDDDLDGGMVEEEPPKKTAVKEAPPAKSKEPEKSKSSKEPEKAAKSSKEPEKSKSSKEPEKSKDSSSKSRSKK